MDHLTLTDQVEKIANELLANCEEGCELSYFEALQIASKVQQNSILARAFVVGTTDENPTALEMIGIQLRYFVQNQE